MSAAMLRRIILILAVAVLVWGGLALMKRSRTDSPAGLALPALPPSDVGQVFLGRGADTVLLTNAGSKWTVNGVPASQGAIAAFLLAASDSTARSELIARSANPHARLGVDTAQARRFTVTVAGKAVLDLLVGNRGPDFEGFYVRRPDEDAVYLLRGDFAEALARGMDEWRDREILAIAADSIGGITVRLGRENFSVARSAGRWTVGGAPGDSIKVARYLAQFGDVRASGYPDPAQLEALSFSPPEREVALLAPDGRTLERLELDSTEAAFWLRNAAGVVYRIDRATADRLTPAAAGLR